MGTYGTSDREPGAALFGVHYYKIAAKEDWNSLLGVGNNS
jgi:hypothetical protein